MSDETTNELFEQLVAQLPTDEDATNQLPRPAELEEIVTGREPSSWRPIPLNGELEDDAPPSVLNITGTTRHLLYPGSINSVFGETEAGKSWLSLLATREVIERGGRVLFLDYEDSPRRFLARMDAMGVDRDLVRKLVDYVKPTHALWNNRNNASTEAHADFVAMLRAHKYELGVVDTMTGAMSVEGLDPLSMTDVEQVYRVLCGRIVTETGAAVLVNDHVTKSTEGRGRYAIGSERKLSGITGAAYYYELTRPWSRATIEPVYGSADLKIAKDRAGWVRGGRAELSVVATLNVTAEPDGGIYLQLVDPRDTVPTPPHELLLKVITALRRFPGMSKGALEKEVGGKTATVRLALNWLVDRQVVRVDARGNGQYLHLDETRLRELDLE